MHRTVLLSPDAVRQFRKLRAAERAGVRDAMEASLARDDATAEARNRFRLRRPAEAADYELRVGDLRVFYRVAGRTVQVALIGRKKGDVVLTDGKRFVL